MMGRKIHLFSDGVLSGKNKSAGFTSLLLLAGLSVAAGSMLYSATARTRNMNNMLQTDRYRNSRDAIANALRNSVSIPALLYKSANNDSGSDLLGCIDASNATACDVLDAAGQPKKHPLKVFDTQDRQLAGVEGDPNPISYDAASGDLCDPADAARCQIQATAWFTISCGTDLSCKGRPSALLQIGFKVELKPTAELPNHTALRPIEAVPFVNVALSAIQAETILPSASPGDPNLPYNPIVDSGTAVDIANFNPASGGSVVCNSMKALGNPAIAYDDPNIPTTGAPGAIYSNIPHDLHAADENISTISNITGNVWATAKTISTVSNVNNAITQGVSLNAPTISTVSNIDASHTYLIGHNIGTVSNVRGYLYTNADTVGLYSNVSNNDYFIAVNRDWVTSGGSSATPTSFSNITSGKFLLCGFNVSTLSNVAASFIGIQNGSIQGVSSNVNVGQLVIYGGSVGMISSFTGNLTIYNATVGDMSNITGNVTFYNSTVGNMSNVHGNVQAYGGSITQVTTLDSGKTVDLYSGATLGGHPGVDDSQIITH